MKKTDDAERLIAATGKHRLMIGIPPSILPRIQPITRVFH
jgi:hypothetical protein